VLVSNGQPPTASSSRNATILGKQLLDANVARRSTSNGQPTNGIELTQGNDPRQAVRLAPASTATGK